MPEHLDRHDAPKPPIARAVDLAHSAFAKFGDDFVRSEARTGLKCHDLARAPPRWREALAPMTRNYSWTST